MIAPNALRTFQFVSASQSQTTSRMPEQYIGPDDVEAEPQRRQSPGPDDVYDPDQRGRYDDYYSPGFADPDGSGSYNGI